MPLADKVKQMVDKAKSYVVQNKDKTAAGIAKAEQTIDTRTGGKYHDQITKAGDQAGQYIDKLPDTQPGTIPNAGPDAGPVGPGTVAPPPSA